MNIKVKLQKININKIFSVRTEGYMKNIKFLIMIILIVSCTKETITLNKQFTEFQLDLNNRRGDTFKVTVIPSYPLSKKTIYQFAATAPGSYQIMDIGRFVKVFKAFDKNGKRLKVKKRTKNSWEIYNSKNLQKVYYEILDTWDSNVQKNVISEMCGSSLEDDHALINGQAVFGYFQGQEETEIRLTINKPSNWNIATVLSNYDNHKYHAKNYLEIVHSPILAGNISSASLSVNGTDFTIYSYSKTGLIKANQLVEPMNTMLEAAENFMLDFPVKNYSFLFHFEDKTVGAWEHPKSSTYVWEESEYDDILEKELISVAAHEFFHTITPLSIRSEKIHNFDFTKLNSSEHLWFYEGVTEWASEMMLLRSDKITSEEFLERLSMKYVFMQFYDESYSLSKIGLNCFMKEGQEQYGNIYQKGAVLAALLDIKLLETSKGKYGLRELVLDLSKQYDLKNPFPEKKFYHIIDKMTDANFKRFKNEYIQGKKPLNIDKYFQYIGYRFHEQYQSDVPINEMGLDMEFSGSNFKIENLSFEMYEYGLRDNDQILAINGKKLQVNTANEIIDDLLAEPLGAAYSMTIRRNGNKKRYQLRLLRKFAIFSNIFLLNEEASGEAKQLQKSWLKNLVYE